MRLIKIFITGLLAMLFFNPVEAQKGVGNEEGVSRSNADIEMAELSGEYVRMKEGPCENTTGRSLSGTHIFLKNDTETTYNVHLGPTASVKYITEKLENGQNVKVTAFRTPEHAENHYVAKEIFAGDEHYILRDDNLKPRWSNKGKGRRGRGRGKGRF